MENETRLWSEGSVSSGGGLTGTAFSAFLVFLPVFAFACGPNLLDGTWFDGTWTDGTWVDDTWLDELSDSDS